MIQQTVTHPGELDEAGRLRAAIGPRPLGGDRQRTRGAAVEETGGERRGGTLSPRIPFHGAGRAPSRDTQRRNTQCVERALSRAPAHSYSSRVSLQSSMCQNETYYRLPTPGLNRNI